MAFLVLWLAAALLGFFRVSAVTNSISPSEGLVFRSWGTDVGLPQNTVSAMVQTRDGYIWLGTREGLTRFDGVRFTVLGLSDGLQSVDVQTLLEDRKGTLWIGTSGGGLSRLVDGQIENVTLPQRSLAGDNVQSLAEDAEGRLWIGTRAGLAIYQDGVFVTNQAVEITERVPVTAMMRDRSGSMWIATSALGLMQFDGQQVVESRGPPGSERIAAYCLLQDQKGNIWASIGNGTVLYHYADEWHRYGQTNGLPFEYITCMAEEADGTIWAGSLDHGLYRFQDGYFAGVKPADGLSAGDIRCVKPDREGNLWVGTRTGGLNRLSRRKLITYGLAQGLTNDFTRSVAETPDGELWVGTIGGGLYRGVNGRFAGTADEGDAPRHAFVNSVLYRSDGSVWYGANLALFRCVGGEIKENFMKEPWLHLDGVSALCEDEKGGLWIGTTGSKLVHYEAGQFTVFPHRVARGTVTALAQQPDGSLWVGSDGGGLKRVRLGSEEILSVTNGLVSHAIRTLYLDSAGTLWIGTTGGGLGRWREGKVTSFTTKQGMGTDTISQIIGDNEGDLWLGCSRGIFRVRTADLEALASGQISLINPRSYGLNEGMPVEECSSGFAPAGLKTKSGLLCFSTVKGLVLIDPRKQETDAAAPTVILEDVRVNGHIQARHPKTIAGTNVDSLLAAGGQGAEPELTIPAGGRDIEFDYTAISFAAPDKIRFRYTLEGLGGGWIEAGSGRSAFYHAIPAGRYRFQVMVSSANSAWSKPTPLLIITVRPYLWESVWFRIVAGLCVLGLFAIAVRVVERRRYKRRLARLEMQHAVERERLRISQDMHDHIGAMLTQVSMASDLGQTDSHSQPLLRGHFDRIGDQARAAVQALDEIVWATNPKNDNLPRFVEYVCRFADECFEFSPIRCWQEVPTKLPNTPLRADVRHNVFSAVKESFNNVLKHSGATEVSLRIVVENSEVVLTVKDNGRGFVPEQTKPGSEGMENMKTRLVECGGHSDLKSSPGQGTVVNFYFPLPK